MCTFELPSGFAPVYQALSGVGTVGLGGDFIVGLPSAAPTSGPIYVLCVLEHYTNVGGTPAAVGGGFLGWLPIIARTNETGTTLSDSGSFGYMSQQVGYGYYGFWDGIGSTVEGLYYSQVTAIHGYAAPL